MKLVIIESPYAGDVEANVAYARDALRDSLMRGEAPFASHLLYTQPGVLNDEVPVERTLGIHVGFEWALKADLVAVYIDLGISSGMKHGLIRAHSHCQLIELRSLRRMRIHEMAEVLRAADVNLDPEMVGFSTEAP